MRWVKWIVEAVVLTILFGFTWAIITLPLPMVFQDGAKQPIADAVPGNFPYLVLTPAADGELSPAIVLHDQLEGYKGAHPDYTFLVPEDQSVRLRDELLRREGIPADGASGEEGFWSPMFMVNRKAGELARYEVHAPFDADHENTGWYEATDGVATPRFHESYNRSAAGLRLLLTGTLINIGVWAVLITAYRSRKKRRQQPIPALESPDPR